MYRVQRENTVSRPLPFDELRVARVAEEDEKRIAAHNPHGMRNHQNQASLLLPLRLPAFRASHSAPLSGTVLSAKKAMRAEQQSSYDLHRVSFVGAFAQDLPASGGASEGGSRCAALAGASSA